MHRLRGRFAEKKKVFDGKPSPGGYRGGNWDRFFLNLNEFQNSCPGKKEAGRQKRSSNLVYVERGDSETYHTSKMRINEQEKCQ